MLQLYNYNNSNIYKQTNNIEIIEFQDLLQRPEAQYVIGGAISLATGIVGYVIGRVSSRTRTREYDLKLAQIDLEKERLQLEEEKTKITLEEVRNRPQIMGLEEELRQKEFERNKESDETKYQRSVNERDYAYQQQAQVRTQNLDALVKISSELRLAFERFMEEAAKLPPQQSKEVDPAYLQKREEYRLELVDELITERKDNSIEDDDFEILDEDLRRIYMVERII